MPMRLFPPINPPVPAWPHARVWVIGASTGIGAATARMLLDAGARVALSARSTDKLHEVAAGDANALVEPLDFTDSLAVTAAWTRIRAQWREVDLVLIVAGTHKEMRAWELNEKDSRALLEINLHGVLNTTGAVVPGLLAQGHGAIGIVASVAGYRGLPKALVYGASKAAVINFTETLYMDLHPKGLGVYLIMPGFVKTPLTDQNDFKMPHLITAEEAAQEIVAGVRAGKFEIDFPRAFTRQLKFLRLLPYRWYFALIRKATGL
ncbi:MAG: SDR family NAD(P)-dependent oxidoreductase [Betaproteobacteria bacterium]